MDKQGLPDTTGAITQAIFAIQEQDVRQVDDPVGLMVKAAIAADREALADAGAEILMPSEVPSWMEPTDSAFIQDNGMVDENGATLYRLSPNTKA